MSFLEMRRVWLVAVELFGRRPVRVGQHPGYQPAPDPGRDAAGRYCARLAGVWT